MEAVVDEGVDQAHILRGTGATAVICRCTGVVLSDGVQEES